jgi:hypothetical protein
MGSSGLADGRHCSSCLPRGLGAGDVKLLAALGAWLGPRRSCRRCLPDGRWRDGSCRCRGAVACGGVPESAAPPDLLARVGRPLDSVSLGGSRGPRLPYALPIAAGVLMRLWLR